MTDLEQTPPADEEDQQASLDVPGPAPLAWTARFASPLTRLDVAVLILIVVATGLTYFLRLDAPGELIPLDEKHYVPDARDVLAFGTESDTRVSEESGAFVVHPPVGKWFIAAGIKLIGDGPTGWRFFGAAVGALSVVLLYLLARRLWASAWFAALAALLLATEGLWFVQSRIAMLDIYAGFFVLAGIWMLVEDRWRTDVEHRGRRWWRLGASAAFAFGLATKWSVLPFFLAGFLLASVFEGARLRALRRRNDPFAQPWSGWVPVRAGGALLATFFLLPPILYVATYAPWFLDDHRYDPPRCVPTAEEPKSLGRRWLCYQREMLDFHRNLEKYETKEEERTVERRDGTTATETVTVTDPAHPYFSQGFSWPWIGRPVAHAYEATGEGDAERRAEVLGAPNPVTWIPAFVVGIPLLAWWTIVPVARRLWRRRRSEDARAPSPLDPVAPVLLLLLAAGYGPILLADVLGRSVFLFYATPMVPFLVLTSVHLMVRLTRGGTHTRWAPALYAALAVAAFGFLYPVLAAYPLPPDGWTGWAGRILYGTREWELFGWTLPFPPVDCTAEHVIKTFCWI